MTRFHKSACVLTFLVPMTMAAQSQPLRSDSAVRVQVLAAEAALERALIRMDRQALDTLYADDLESWHWSGSRDTKTSWTAFIFDSITYRRHSPRIDHLDLYPNAAWVSGVMSSEAKLKGTQAFEVESLAFGHLWVSDGHRWRLREQTGRKLTRPIRKP